ncbi:hypothetical protein [Natranaerofaba carboxydovora]|uniref:hypothetical protein n=1 Tax=Natranaerofaba carboxydovora TaxID=2742683 RepID=UPI001F1420F8|nr:hypothetical protein [Natranaerofaba carboxydovora]UMZ73647.1 hypothetical protein ACONDI_01210 [Natranaerofaba carboxydovora]
MGVICITINATKIIILGTIVTLMLGGGFFALGCESTSESSQKPSPEAKDDIDNFDNNLRNTLMRLEDLATYCNDEPQTNDTDRIETQLESIKSDFNLLNEKILEMCPDSNSNKSPTYFEAYEEYFILPRLDDLVLDDKAEKELGVIVYDLRLIISMIYPLEDDTSIFFGLDDWEKDNLKLTSYEDFCQAVSDRMFGEIPQKIYEGNREIDEDKVYDFDDSPAGT